MEVDHDGKVFGGNPQGYCAVGPKAPVVFRDPPALLLAAVCGITDRKKHGVCASYKQKEEYISE